MPCRVSCTHTTSRFTRKRSRSSTAVVDLLRKEGLGGRSEWPRRPRLVVHFYNDNNIITTLVSTMGGYLHMKERPTDYNNKIYYTMTCHMRASHAEHNQSK